MGFLGTLFRVIIVDLCVDTVFRLVCNPFANKKFVLVVIEIGALALAEIINPVAFEMIAVALGHHAVTVSF